MSKRFAVLLAVTSLALFWCVAVNARTTVREVKACQKIGNIQGTRPVTCIGEGGEIQGRGALSFKAGKDIFILMRFRSLPVGFHNVRVVYERADLNGKYSEVETKTMSFRNETQNWAWWFKSNRRDSGKWRVKVFAGGTHVILGSVDYCVDCFGGD